MQRVPVQAPAAASAGSRLREHLRGLGMSAVLAGLGLALVAAVPGRDADAVAATPAPEAHRAVSFANDVMPILKQYCTQCHGDVKDGEKQLEEGLDLTSHETLMQGSTWGTVVEAGNADESLLIQMIVDGDMPKDAEEPFPAEKLEVLRTWVNEGAQNN
ncbi:MAG: c-type cytochrome domain-containing protein [Gemmatimonadota bacterium]|nr:hypothetical protein [Gemmatimonadota bacterium]